MRWFRSLIAPTRIIYILFFIYIVCRFCSFSFENKLFTGWEEKRREKKTIQPPEHSEKNPSDIYVCIYLSFVVIVRFFWQYDL